MNDAAIRRHGYRLLGFVLPLLLFGPLQTGQSAEFRHVTVDKNGPADMHTKSVGDLNGDGLVDLVVAGTRGTIVWYENPSLAKHVVATEGGGWSTDAEVGDIDRDGDQDIVASDWYQRNRMVWFENKGSGQTWAMHVIGEPRAHDIELGDLDRDGDFDIVTRTQGSDGNKIQIWEQKGASSWERRTIACPAGEGLTLADLDADGDPDVVIAARWYETPSKIAGGDFAEHVYSTSWNHTKVATTTGDINQDRRLDIVLTPAESRGGKYRCSWFEAPTDPERGRWKEHIIDRSIETVTHGVGVGDMDGDGDLDVVTAEMHQGADPDEVRMYVNQGKGTTWKKQVIAETGSHSLRLVDLGGDGDLDIFGANWSGTSTVDLWENLTRH